MVYGPAKKEWHRILTRFYLESRLETVSKPAIPSGLKCLFDKGFVSKPDNLISGFRKHELFPVNKDAVPKSKLLSSSMFLPKPSSPRHHQEPAEIVTPSTAKRFAMVIALHPAQSQTTKAALANATKRRRRVQKSYSDVLTADICLERLGKEKIRATKARKKKEASR